jgi:hypothetical protein
MWWYGLDWAGSLKRQMAGSFECGSEPTGSINCAVFIHSLQTH